MYTFAEYLCAKKREKTISNFTILRKCEHNSTSMDESLKLSAIILNTTKEYSSESLCASVCVCVFSVCLCFA